MYEDQNRQPGIAAAVSSRGSENIEVKTVLSAPRRWRAAFWRGVCPGVVGLRARRCNLACIEKG